MKQLVLPGYVEPVIASSTFRLLATRRYELQLTSSVGQKAKVIMHNIVVNHDYHGRCSQFQKAVETQM